MTEMLADARAREHMGEEQALVDLGAVLVALPMSGLRVDLGARRNQPGDELRRGVDEVVEPPERRAALRQAIVDKFDMSGEKRLARRVRVRQQRLRRRPFRFVPPGLRRQPPKQSRRAAPEGAVLASVGLELASRDREGLGPFPRVMLRQASGAQWPQSGFRRRRHAFGLLSMTCFALPSDRSISPGLSTLTAALMPICAFIACSSSRGGMRARFVEIGLRSSLDLNLQIVQPAFAGQDELIVGGKAGDTQDQLLDLRREHIDAAHDHHVVRSARDFFHPPHRACGPRQKPGQISGAVADDRHRFLGERGKYDLAEGAVGQDGAGRGIDDLGIKMILPNMEAILGLDAFARDAQARSLPTGRSCRARPYRRCPRVRCASHWSRVPRQKTRA